MRLLIVISFVFFLFTNSAYSQTYVIGEQSQIIDNNGIIVDSGGENSNYSNSENFTMTIYSGVTNHGIRIHFSDFQTQTITDILTIYNGNNTSSDIIASGSGTSLQNIIISSTDTCITLSWHSSYYDNYRGFIAEFESYDLNTLPYNQDSCQNYSMEVMADIAGFDASDELINLCIGDSVNFSTVSHFYELWQHGYYQNNYFMHYNWSITTVQNDTLLSITQQGLTNFGYNFNDYGIYFLRLETQDFHNCTSDGENLFEIHVIEPLSEVQISTISDTICTGEAIFFEVNNNITVYNGLQYTYIDSTFTCLGGMSGDYEYSHMKFEFEVTEFYDDQVIQSGDDISIFTRFDHDFINDVTLYVKCPNSTVCTINSSTQQGITGNFGYPANETGQVDCSIGVGSDYHWTMDASIYVADAVFDYSLPSGDYLPMQSFDNLIGCPLNGEWIVGFADYWANDDGMIYRVELDFNDQIPVLNGYGSFSSSTNYGANSANIVWSGIGMIDSLGTTATAVNNVFGTHEYNLNITNIYGCVSDTSIYVEVLPMINDTCCVVPCCSVQDDFSLCESCTTIYASEPANGNSGFWSQLSGPNDCIIESANNFTTQVCFQDSGEYLLVWTELFHNSDLCKYSDTLKINFSNLDIDFEDFINGDICDTIALGINDLPANLVFEWAPSTALNSPNISNPLTTVCSSTYFYVTVTDLFTQCSTFDSVFVNITEPIIPEICLLTSTENNETEIYWHLPISDNISSTKIYKKNDFGDYFLLLESPYLNGNSIIDISSVSQTTADSYKISFLYSCNYETELSQFHSTFFLEANQEIDNYHLVWENYQGVDFGEVNILKGLTYTEMSIIATVPSSQTEYFDTDIIVGQEYFYRLQIASTINCDESKNQHQILSNISPEPDFTTVNNSYLSDNFDMEIFPNPASNNIFIKSPYNNAELKVFNSFGQIVVYENNFDSRNIDISMLRPGIYLVKINIGINYQTKKLTVK